ncbi:MAG TPA: NAD(P)/FAD-dependent oxidoreductase [Streptosporangiaceae bacterium]
MSRPRVVIVGAGFAGLAAAKALAGKPWYRARVDVTVVDCRNHHVFTPFLYQVATALLEPSGTAQPVRALLRKLPNIDVRLAQVTGLNLTLRRVETDRGPVAYDYLILAAGAVNDYFANPRIAGRSLALNDLDEALTLRNHILGCFEAARWAAGDPARRARLLTFAVVGGGPTGVEFSAALAVLVKELTGRGFPGIGAAEPRIVLVEASAAPLGSFAADLREAAAAGLRARGVEIRSGAEVTDVDEDGLTMAGGDRIDAVTVVWAAGVRANALAAALPVTGSHGRVVVDPTLQIPRHPEIFVVGDMAQIPGRAGPLPMVAQVAIQSGRRAARSVLALCAGGKARRFRYRDLGTMATVGRGDAVAQIGQLHLSGLTGWLAWLGVHIARTAGPEAKASVILGSVRGFIFGVRPVQIITGPGQRASVRPELAGTATGPARDPRPPARAGLPSVNVGNANDFGRIAALSWWTQDLPGRRPAPGPSPGSLKRLSTRMTRLRHAAFGIKSQAKDNYSP